jgi:hypothetical protein
MMMKIKMVTTARWKIRNKLSLQMIASQLQFNDVKKAIEATKVARGIYSRDVTQGRGILRAIDAVFVSTPHSNGAAKMAKKMHRLFTIILVVLLSFLPLHQPDDDASSTVQILSQKSLMIKQMSTGLILMNSQLEPSY